MKLILPSLSIIFGLCISCFAEESSPTRPLMRDFIGINGHTIQFKPELYRPLATLVRDYHPVEWDLGDDTSTPAPFPMAHNGVDWNLVYGSWRERGWRTSACLMFESIPRDSWKNIANDAESYGESFAREFGPSGNRPLVESVEIGNEPGAWTDQEYSQIFQAMAAGIRNGDPKLKIATCNLTTGKSGDYAKSVTCLGDDPSKYDILTIHTYAELEGWPTWKRSYPEDPALPNYLQDVEALCEWRDANAQGKPVWITEFGYDSTTQPNHPDGDFAKWEGVTDLQQAQWLVRSLLVFSTMPVERAYLYFFNDDDAPQLHGSSGITRNFKPKPAYHAVAQLNRLLGDCRFEKIIPSDSAMLRIQQYRDDDDHVIWAVWSPTGSDRTEQVILPSLPEKFVSAHRMALEQQAGEAATVTIADSGELSLEIGESPIYLRFE